MNWDQDFDKTNEGTRHDAEETLRLLAALPSPEALTSRVHARLQATEAVPARRSFWSYWLPAQRFQFAGAAALALAVVGATWGVNHQHSPQGAANQTARPAAPAAITGGFGTAGTARVPPTLNPIKVPPSPHRKPGAGHTAAKQTPKPAVAPATVPTNP